MSTLFNQTKIIVCVGSGGVGKTTLSAAIGFLAAKNGKKVLVLTIDPSQRLKTTLQLSEDGSIKKIEHSQFMNAGGQLSAAVIHAKKTFDEFIIQASQNNQQRAEKILNNKLYIQLSTTLSGSQEFTALERLYSAHVSGNYDLIILDTPPAQHAIDFLKAPQKLSHLFNEGVARWFRTTDDANKPILSRIFQTGTKQVLRILENLTGSIFMSQLADFFNQMQGLQIHLDDRIQSVHRLLVDQQTQFCLVTSLEKAKLEEADYFTKEIKKDGYQLNTVFMNKTYPLWMDSGEQLDEKTDLRQDFKNISGSELMKLYKEIKKYYSEKNQLYYSFSKRLSSMNKVYRLPELQTDISNLDEVAFLASIMEKELMQHEK